MTEKIQMFHPYLVKLNAPPAYPRSPLFPLPAQVKSVLDLPMWPPHPTPLENNLL